MSRSTGFIRVLGLFCISTLSQAADLSGSHDLSIVPRLPDAQIVDYRPEVELDRIYPLGAIRRISGRLRFDAQVASRGTLTSVTYLLPPERTSNQAFTVAREALQKNGAQLLFWCEARDCGSSELWANQVFGNATLYGGDEQQAYLLLRLAAPQDNTLVALYGITRGNQRAYLHIEQFAATTPLGALLPTSATLLRELKSTGVLNFPTLMGEPQAVWVTLIARALNLDSTSRVSLSGPGAEAWRQALIAQGVRAARLESGSEQSAGLHLQLLR